MLVWLLDVLSDQGLGGAVVTALGKSTFRAAFAALVSFALALLLGPRWIAMLAARFREPNKSDSETLRQLHAPKQATPTMGGLFLVAGLAAGVLILGDLSNPYVWLALGVIGGLGLVGAIDDLAKLRGPSKGLTARSKLVGQLLVAVPAALVLYHLRAAGTPDVFVPGFGGVTLGAWCVPLVALVIVASTNAVNLTDGLDGLAGGCIIFAAGALAVMAYVAGHVDLAAYLHVPRVAGAGEMVIVVAGLIGAVMGFLWFNCHPAQVFMGDTGSLALGGLLGLVACIARQEILWLFVGGVFVAEAASVLLQVGYFKWRGRRLFRCAPLHHHFQFLGWPESRIVVRFWIAAVLCAIVGLAGLKLSVDDQQPTSAMADRPSTPSPRAGFAQKGGQSPSRGVSGGLSPFLCKAPLAGEGRGEGAALRATSPLTREGRGDKLVSLPSREAKP